jgi:hypothetical protein
MRRFSSDEKMRSFIKAIASSGQHRCSCVKVVVPSFDFMIRFVLLTRFPFKRLLVVGAVIFLGCGLIPRAVAVPLAENQ